ncbi:SphA family protein [Tunicatimonas pelagia]|uniref:SphA family protein n=1 Tax=Tunicatimonas pelagia TaxID=931531 RepID=UPI0026650BDA|nr:transporter [Tunicatimonas pelagia]WKN44857.1 transporter [Tunicatimonas pelagia]
MITLRYFFLLLLSGTSISVGWTQDPVQPALNLGLTGMLDGAPPATGLFYFSYLEHYAADELVTPGGRIPIDLDATVWLHQLSYISEKKVLGGHLGSTALFPIVRLQGSGQVGTDGDGQPVMLTENPGIAGDLVITPLIQWFDKRLFGKPFFHRFEPSWIIPVGSYNPSYLLNPGSNHVSFQPFYAFTLFLSDRWALSQRHHYVYHFENPGNNWQTGQAYYGVYSVEYRLDPAFWVALQGYALHQLTEDRVHGEISSAAIRERIAAVGPSINYFIKGWVIGIKTQVEFAAQGRPEGIRSRIRVAKSLTSRQ